MTMVDSMQKAFNNVSDFTKQYFEKAETIANACIDFSEPYVRATSVIYHGEEFLTPYGAEYWLSRKRSNNNEQRQMQTEYMNVFRAICR